MKLLVLVFQVVLLILVVKAADNATYDACDDKRPGGAVCTCGVASSAPPLIIYDCRLRRLTSVPTTYGNDTYEINLSNNKILQVERGKFTNLRDMELLYLQANYIRYIEAGAFRGLMRLKEIFLQTNRLENVSNDVFDHLPALEKVHLENNFITTIERYAFFFTPSLSVINMDNNPLTCACEEKLFREFLDTRIGLLTLSKARCSNFANADLATLNTGRFPDCGGESLFVTNNNCFTCASAKSPKDCGNNSTGTPCSGSRDVCFGRVEFNSGHLGYWGGCSDYTGCLDLETTNADKCRRGAITYCHYCSLGKRTNRFDVLNTVKSFEVLAIVTLNATLTPALQDPTSLTRKNYETNFINVVNGLIYGKQGSFEVVVDDIRSPYVTIQLSISCHTIWYISKPSVLTALNASVAANGYYLNGSPLISLRLILKEEALSLCLPETVSTVTFGTFYWPETSAGTVSIINCPNKAPGGGIITASRACIHESAEMPARWSEASIDQCYPSAELSADLQHLANIHVTDVNVIDVSTNVSRLSENWSEYTKHELAWTVDILEGILGTNAITTSRDAIKSTLQTINNVLYIEPFTLEVGESEYDTSSRLVQSVDVLLAKIDVGTEDFGEVRDNLAGFVIKTEPDTFTGISLFTDIRNENPLASGKVDIDTSDSGVGTGKSGIQIPTSAISSLSDRQRSQISKGQLNLYREPKIFNTILLKPSPKEIVLENNETVVATRQINSHVIGASFPGVSIKDLNEPIKVTFQHFQDAINPECVYWKNSANGSQWANDGCRINTTDTSFTVCDCDHLTNFALLMDVYGSGGSLSDEDKMALSIISYIGCGVSFIAMCLTITTFLMFKKLRKENPGKILMNLCLAIGLADLVFVAGMQGYTSNSQTGCKVVAALLHFFLLSAICWMAVEAFYMYLALVKVFDTYIARFQLKSSLVGWGIPFIVIVLTLCINTTDNYGVQPGGICWLSRIPFYAAFLAPVILIIIINSIVFVFVMKQIVNRSSNKLTKTEKSGNVVRLRGAVSVIILLGLTWIFAIFAVGDFGVVFHYLFALSNSLQGLFIFVFYCVLKSDVRNLWKRKCSCFKSPYEATDSGTRSRDRGLSSASEQTVKTNVTSSQGRDGSRRPSDNNGKTSPTPSPLLTKPPTAFRGRWQLQQTAPKQTVDNPDILSFTDV